MTFDDLTDKARARTRIAAIGECMIEITTGSDGDLHRSYGGDTLNTTVYLARLLRERTAQIDYLTALGDDAFSRDMIAAWQAEGIDTSCVRSVAGALPGMYWIATDAHGERSFHYWRSESPARELCSSDNALRLTTDLAGHDLLYFSGISLAILRAGDRERLLSILAAARAAGALLVLDTNYRPRLWEGPDVAARCIAAALQCCDLVLGSADDHAALFGDGSARDSCRRLVDCGVAEIVMRDGSGPCVVAAAGQLEASPPAEAGAIVDTTAAGDSFNAGYIAARLAGLDSAAAVRTGQGLAAAVIGWPGAILPADRMPALSALGLPAGPVH